ncbi:CLUMA_CG010614, isoform A [Clunio marinus]|uniref:CLUMA_CG010614, isoform A n=1 Tax=Clunio marinus TaxID=568069 RepID=A0A1J1IFI7_9DIPT|nr:CLUMA_CG010614, isoform A [Clunio marinus]
MKKRAAQESRTGRGTIRSYSPPASRTRSKSPARIENSGRDSAAIVRRGRPKKTDTPSEEVSSSSQSSTPKKEIKKAKNNAAVILDDSGDNEEVATINTRSTRLASLRKRLTPVNYKITPTPSEDQKRSVSRSVSSLTKEDSEDEEDEVEIIPPSPPSLGIFSKPLLKFFVLETLLLLPIILTVSFKGPLKWTRIFADFRNPATYCNLQSASFFVAFLTSTVLLHAIPLGKIVKLPTSEVTHKFNGLFTALVIVAFLFGLELKGLDSLTAIYNNIDRFMYLSIITNIIVAGALYVRGKRSALKNPNPYATGHFINEFTTGLEINPRIYDKLDVKVISYHRSVILILIINIALLFKNVSIPTVETSSGLPIAELVKETYNNFMFVIRNSEYNSTSLVISGLLVIYALDLLIFEHHLATSFQINSEGCGAELLLRFATFPFLLSFLPRFLLVKKLNINNYLLAAIAVGFLLGLIIKRSSNKLKYEYRIRPNDAKFQTLKTLPTLQNHRLIISRWWSKIRQPNLFGEILIHKILLAPLLFNFNWPAFIAICFIIKYLVCRSIIINRINAKKYESSWQRYTSTIKYNLLPKVY